LLEARIKGVGEGALMKLIIWVLPIREKLEEYVMILWVFQIKGKTFGTM
jgi:hypothetical protein